jgi:ribonuclease E
MTKRMLIDATHAEETRVVVLEGNRLEDFDVETQSRRQLKGNIYLAKVVRVEPSLQAAFVEYGGNRHGFLAFAEIHPDYYQIPVADRQRLLQMQEEEARAEEEEADALHGADEASPLAGTEDNSGPQGGDEHAAEQGSDEGAAQPLHINQDVQHGDAGEPSPGAEAAVDDTAPDQGESQAPAAGPHHEAAAIAETPQEAGLGADTAPEAAEPADSPANTGGDSFVAESTETQGDDGRLGSRVQEVPQSDLPPPETIGGENDTGDEVRERRSVSRFTRNYKIQEVIRRRQILLIQVVKEERGTKGAALTTYISLAGRFCVLMPNSPRGGGISRKITSATDRRRLKEVTAELEIPRGMGLIVRTAGANRPKPEIKRDCEYLLRLWDDIREHTLRSVAPALIYEEASLIKRAIRDVYSRDVDEILVDGEDGWKAARDFMRMLMPTHVKKVQLWRDGGVPLFTRQQVEAQLDSMLVPSVQLRSGGYLVINQTEALVAIDVNSGRSTRERGIEETALRTNLEAADEVARQLRLRDLAGLIVIDFIDMESKKHNAAVERRMKDALKNDRARIQVGHISHFGLMEMSRQRLRPSLAETSMTACPHCGGTGHVRSTEGAALHILRTLEEEGSKRRAAEILVHVASSCALYILNNKRARLADIEQRYSMKIGFAADETLLPAQTRIERLRAPSLSELPPPVTATQSRIDAPELDLSDDNTIDRTSEDMTEDADDLHGTDAQGSEASGDDARGGDTEDRPVPGETAEEGERRRRRRRRRRRGGRRDDAQQPGQAAADSTGEPGGQNDALLAPDGDEQPDIGADAFPVVAAAEWTRQAAASDVAAADARPDGVPGHDEAAEASDESGKPRARSRRGRGRRKRPEDGATEAPAAEAFVPTPAYAGPTPADPYGGGTLDIFDVLEMAESQHLAAAAPQPPQAVDATTQIVDAVALAPPPALMAEAVAPVAIPEPPTAEAAPDIALAAAAPEAPPEAVTGPAIRPVVIGEGEPAAEKKRGWWRR